MDVNKIRNIVLKRIKDAKELNTVLEMVDYVQEEMENFITEAKEHQDMLDNKYDLEDLSMFY